MDYLFCRASSTDEQSSHPVIRYSNYSQINENVGAVIQNDLMNNDDLQQSILTEITSYSSMWDENEYLRPFSSSFSVEDSENETESKYIGAITGWFGISVVDRPIRIEADSISADSATIGGVAQDFLDAQEWGEDHVEHILLLDRMSIKTEYRGQGLLLPMVDTLITSFGFHKAGCLLVTEPEPQKPGGGPYPDGAKRSKALAGLKRSLKAAGFVRWRKGTCYVRTIPVK